MHTHPTGTITDHQLRSVLNMLRLEVSGVELGLIAQKFVAIEGTGKRVDYRAFAQDLAARV